MVSLPGVVNSAGARTGQSADHAATGASKAKMVMNIFFTGYSIDCGNVLLERGKCRNQGLACQCFSYSIIHNECVASFKIGNCFFGIF
jgi:hypothetical protein